MLVMSLWHFWLTYYSLIIRTEKVAAFVQTNREALMALRICFRVCHCSAPHMGQLLQCAVGHPGSRHLHSWQAPGPGPDHHHGVVQICKGGYHQNVNPCMYTPPRTVFDVCTT